MNTVAAGATKIINTPTQVKSNSMRKFKFLQSQQSRVDDEAERRTTSAAALDEVRRLHMILLRQEPDSEILTTLAADLVSGKMVTSDIVESIVLQQAEQATQPGTKSEQDNDRSYENIVMEAYQIVLLREADESGLAGFVAALSSGNISVSDVFRELITSDEFERIWKKRQLDLINLPRKVSEDHGNSDVDELINVVYKMFLQRSADESALRAFGSGMENGTITIVDMIRQILNSPEFGIAAIRIPSVSEHVVSTVIQTIMQRLPADDTLQAYSNALQTGVGLASLLTEMLSSKEFIKLSSQANRPDTHAGYVPAELAALTEGLLTSQMVAEGCRISAPPYNSALKRQISEKQMAALIRTLSMLSTSARTLSRGNSH